MFSEKDLKRLIIPLIFEQLLAVTVGMADSLMVSRVGEAAVSGVSIVDSINVLLIGLFAALATGGAVVTAQYLGQERSKEACASAEQLVVITLLTSLVFTVLSLAGNHLILNILFGDVESIVMSYARTYFFYSALSFPFIAVYNACAALFRSMGNSKVSLYTSIVMNGLNILGNAVLIFGLKLGVAGAAISTLIARMVAAIIMYILLRNKKHVIHIGHIKDFRLNLSVIKNILRIGVPNGLENSVFQIGKILVQGIIASFGTAAITANAIAGTIGGFGVLPGSAISLSLITVVGKTMGSHDFDGVKYYTKKLMKITHIAMAIMNGILLLFIPIILKVYNLSDETSLIATQLMVYHCIACVIFWPPSFTLPNALRATNDVKFTMVISIFSMWTFRIGLSYILAKVLGLGVIGVWLAMTVDWIFRGTSFITRFKKEKYREAKIL